MKRWPVVRFPNQKTSVSDFSASPKVRAARKAAPSNRAITDQSGRTQRLVAVPQRMDLGQGMASTAAMMISGKTSALGRPATWRTAK